MNAVRYRASAKQEKIAGDIVLYLPVSWQVISYFLGISMVIAALFLSTATYSRVELVSGTVALDKGIARIVPTRIGTIVAVMAYDGQKVKAGDPIVLIRSGEYVSGSRTTPTIVKESLVDRRINLLTQASLLRKAAQAQHGELIEQMNGLRSEIESLSTQIGEQRRLIAAASSYFDRTSALAERGFISKRDVDQNEAALISRQQQLAQLEQSRSSKVSSLAVMERTEARASANGDTDLVVNASAQAEVRQQLALVDAQEGYTLVSPVDGVVTGLVGRVGQTVTDETLAMVIPVRSTIRAELNVPTSAAGFLSRGQLVRLSIDAFPNETFGTVQAVIVSISAAPLARGTSGGATPPTYLIVAAIPKPWVQAFGKNQPLVPGMTLNARIITQKQSLIRWLFEPLFAIGSR